MNYDELLKTILDHVLVSNLSLNSHCFQAQKKPVEGGDDDYMLIRNINFEP